MKLIYLKPALKCDSFDVAIGIKIPFFRVLVTIEPGRSLLQFVTTNCLIIPRKLPFLHLLLIVAKFCKMIFHIQFVNPNPLVKLKSLGSLLCYNTKKIAVFASLANCGEILQNDFSYTVCQSKSIGEAQKLLQSLML